MLNFIQVSFCFLLFLGLGLGSVVGLGFKVRVRGSGFPSFSHHASKSVKAFEESDISPICPEVPRAFCRLECLILGSRGLN